MSATHRTFRGVVRAGRAAAGLVYCAAALPKIAAPAAFALAVYRYRVLPAAFVNAAAVYLPWIELAAGLAILGAPPRHRRAGLLLGAGLALLFVAATASALARGLAIPCGCLGVGPAAEPLGPMEVARAALLAALCLLLLRRGEPRPAREAGVGGASGARTEPGAALRPAGGPPSAARRAAGPGRGRP